ncbi:hypothetical protein SNEBB_007633 [Seison nebaliae]|nr:hypothetical protein SNEBB_007633 [Seison nebaliae]
MIQNYHGDDFFYESKFSKKKSNMDPNDKVDLSTVLEEDEPDSSMENEEKFCEGILKISQRSLKETEIHLSSHSFDCGDGFHERKEDDENYRLSNEVNNMELEEMDEEFDKMNMSIELDEEEKKIYELLRMEHDATIQRINRLCENEIEESFNGKKNKEENEKVLNNNLNDLEFDKENRTNKIIESIDIEKDERMKELENETKNLLDCLNKQAIEQSEKEKNIEMMEENLKAINSNQMNAEVKQKSLEAQLDSVKQILKMEMKKQKKSENVKVKNLEENLNRVIHSHRSSPKSNRSIDQLPPIRKSIDISRELSKISSSSDNNTIDDNIRKTNQNLSTQNTFNTVYEHQQQQQSSVNTSSDGIVKLIKTIEIAKLGEKRLIKSANFDPESFVTVSDQRPNTVGDLVIKKNLKKKTEGFDVNREIYSKQKQVASSDTANDMTLFLDYGEEDDEEDDDDDITNDRKLTTLSISRFSEDRLSSRILSSSNQQKTVKFSSSPSRTNEDDKQISYYTQFIKSINKWKSEQEINEKIQLNLDKQLFKLKEANEYLFKMDELNEMNIPIEQHQEENSNIWNEEDFWIVNEKNLNDNEFILRMSEKQLEFQSLHKLLNYSSTSTSNRSQNTIRTFIEEQFKISLYSTQLQRKLQYDSLIMLSLNDCSELFDGVLDINNQIFTLFSSLPNILSLHLTNNKIEDIRTSNSMRENLFWSKLIDLNLSHNQLSNLDLCGMNIILYNLLQINLSNNQLQYIHDCFSHYCPKLTVLNLSRNHLNGNYLYRLLNNSLNYLLYIDISHNRLKETNSIEWDNHYLIHCDVSHNELNQLPNIVDTFCLRYFDCSHNNIENFENSFIFSHQHSSSFFPLLQTINLKNNNIENFDDDLNEFACLSSVRNVDFRCNQLMDFNDRQFQHFIHRLQQMLFSGNECKVKLAANPLCEEMQRKFNFHPTTNIRQSNNNIILQMTDNPSHTPSNEWRELMEIFNETDEILKIFVESLFIFDRRSLRILFNFTTLVIHLRTFLSTINCNRNSIEFNPSVIEQLRSLLRNMSRINSNCKKTVEVKKKKTHSKSVNRNILENFNDNRSPSNNSIGNLSNSSSRSEMDFRRSPDRPPVQNKSHKSSINLMLRHKQAKKLQEKRLKHLKEMSVIKLQALWRGYSCRRRLGNEAKEYAAIIIQEWWRGILRRYITPRNIQSSNSNMEENVDSYGGNTPVLNRSLNNKNKNNFAKGQKLQFHHINHTPSNSEKSTEEELSSGVVDDIDENLWLDREHDQSKNLFDVLNKPDLTLEKKRNSDEKYFHDYGTRSSFRYDKLPDIASLIGSDRYDHESHIVRPPNNNVKELDTLSSVSSSNERLSRQDKLAKEWNLQDGNYLLLRANKMKNKKKKISSTPTKLDRLKEISTRYQQINERGVLKRKDSEKSTFTMEFGIIPKHSERDFIHIIEKNCPDAFDPKDKKKSKNCVPLPCIHPKIFDKL